jgi:peptide/nickel transport system substrate-binding protein
VRTISAVLTAIALVVTACQQTGGGGATVTPGASASPTRGGTVVFAIWQEPNTMNPFHGTQTVISVATLPVLEGLVRPDPEGNYQPQLAASVPTLQNSGVTLDGSRMTVTYKLKDGITWSDGKPVTSSDVKFTWESLMKDPKVTSREGYDKIESIETPDPNTAVMRYKEIYAPYLSRFTVLYPKHVLDGVADISTHEYSRKPLGTGPFVVTEFKAADSITLERNPNYREKGKPYLDKIILRSVPSREVAVAQLKAGEVDGMWNILEAQIPDLDKEPNVNLIVAASPSVERLEFNTAKPGDPADSNVKHPILGDVAARRALLMATPKEQIIDKILFGKTKPGTSPAPLGWYSPKDLKQEGYDRAKARQELDRAGWTIGSDGIRTKGGVRASLTIASTSGDKVREQIEQILVDEFKEIGVELRIRNVPSAVLFGSWSQGAARKRGNFDINMYASSYNIDPHSEVVNRFACKNIPTPANSGAGFNYNRFCDPAVDKIIDEAGSTVDPERRKQLYGQVFQRVNDEVLNVWIYNRADIDGFRVNVSGAKAHPWSSITWNTQDWFKRP